MKRLFVFVSVLVVLSLLFTACAPAAEEPAAQAPAEPTQAPAATEAPAAEPPAEEAPAEEAPAAAPEIPSEFPRAETIYVGGASWGPPSTWNPFQTGSLANTTGTIGFVYETLFDFNSTTGELTPWLAESGEWADAATYNLTLRSGLTFSDGETLDSEDVKFSIELCQQYAALWCSPLWTYLTGIEAADATHLTFTFEDPLYQEWDNYLYNLVVVPQHIWSTFTEEQITVGANEKPVGSGAYLYLTHAEDRNVWVRNDNWWGNSVFGAPGPKYIVDITTSSNSVALGMVLKSELDLSNHFLPGVAELASKGYVKTFYPSAPYMLSANTAVLFLNTTKKPMDDAAFRKALAYAIDVPSIVNVAYAQLVKAASPTGLLPALSRFDDPAVLAELSWSFDTARAKELLAAAGYVDTNGDGFVEAPDGSEIRLEVTCPAGWSDWMAAIDIIAFSAQAAGINIQAATPDYGAWNTALMSGTFDMTLNNWATLSNTPWNLYNLLFRHPMQEQMQSGNFGRYENQELFDLVDALAKIPTSDEEAMKAACADIQRVMLTEVPMIPLWYNGLWAQWTETNWVGWPTEATGSSNLPSTWSGYWQIGGLQTFLELTPAGQ